MLLNNFNHSIDIWLTAIEKYRHDQIYAQPSANSWSIGQVCHHLLTETDFFLEQAKICAGSNENEFKEMSAPAKKMFANNDFPNEVIVGPATNTFIPQPTNKRDLIVAFQNLKKEIAEIGSLILHNEFHGKTKHPGLDYFNAWEWIQFADMHFRHHLRQKKRIDEFLSYTSG